jgi:uncharacterized protein (TIGR02594 family)
LLVILHIYQGRRDNNAADFISFCSLLLTVDSDQNKPGIYALWAETFREHKNYCFAVKLIGIRFVETTYMQLPSKHQWLYRIGELPLLVEQFIKIYGVTEVPGPQSNPTILRWAKDLGLQNDYVNDGIAWCGLTMAKLCQLTSKPWPKNPLWALNWLNLPKEFPEKWISVPKEDTKLGDIVVYRRYDHAGRVIGGHVGLAISEDEDDIDTGGGNTGDMVKIAPLERWRLAGVVRFKYEHMPESVKKYYHKRDEPVSTNEA